MAEIAKLLERIAIALEAIAQQHAATKFPWGDTRIDGRVRSQRHWHDKRPATFEELIAIGRSELSDGSHRTRNIGAVSIASLDPIFEENGFADQWKIKDMRGETESYTLGLNWEETCL